MVWRSQKRFISTINLNQNLGGLSVTVTAADNSLQTVLPILYNTARDKGYLDRHNRTFHALILSSSGAYMGDWNGYFSGDSTAIYGNAYSINLDSTYQFRASAGGADAVIKKLGSDPKIQSKSVTYPMAGVNSEQTVDFSVAFDGISGYKLSYAGIQQLNTYVSNGTIKYVEFSNQRISGNTVTWSVHTQRGTGGGDNTCVIQGVFLPA